MKHDLSQFRRRIAQRFSKAATGYDELAVLQKNVADRLLQRLNLIKLTPKVICDLGSGTAYATKQLKDLYPEAQVFGVDVSHGMNVLSAQPSITADAQALPLADESVDFVFSSLTLHWTLDMRAVFSQVCRVLRPGGLFLFSTMGPDTLSELKNAWAQVDEYPHVYQFLDMHDVGDMLLQARMLDPVMDMETFTVLYREVSTLLRELNGLGVSYQSTQSRKTLTGKGRLKALYAAYEAHVNDEGKYPASYEIVYGHAWRGVKPKDNDNTVHIPIEDIKR